LSLLGAKDFDLKVLQQLYRPDVTIDIEVKNEREVELKLVEPLLKDLGYSSNDWVRQMSVHMGRGERNIPDYVFFAKQEKGYEEGKMVLETKYHIKAIELEVVFKQARSYAMRLDSLLIVICDKEAIWIYERINGSFDRSIYIKTYWGEKSGESFQMLKLKIGRDRLMKVGRK
jgi:hypothetical protein